MEGVIAENITKISDQGVVASFLVLVIIGLIWDRQRLLKSHKEMTDNFIAAIKENGQSYANVVTENTRAFIELSSAIKDMRK